MSCIVFEVVINKDLKKKKNWAHYRHHVVKLFFRSIFSHFSFVYVFLRFSLTHSVLVKLTLVDYFVDVAANYVIMSPHGSIE